MHEMLESKLHCFFQNEKKTWRENWVCEEVFFQDKESRVFDNMQYSQQGAQSKL